MEERNAADVAANMKIAAVPVLWVMEMQTMLEGKYHIPKFEKLFVLPDNQFRNRYIIYLMMI
jgi:hypothetical protein